MQTTPSAAADPGATLIYKNVRFSMLTSRLIRMEWSEDGHFEDRASLVFLHRQQPVPQWRVQEHDDWLEIETAHLIVRYRIDSGKFAADNLKISFLAKGDQIDWVPGKEDIGNLGGTARTLDGVSGTIPLEQGIISRDGWAVVDDSTRPVFDNSEWAWVQKRQPGDQQDWYFFGYGQDYRAALGDFVSVAGRIPLPPRYAFGLWWSRYWAYTDQELLQLASDFERNDVPLDVFVVDMDWHKTFNLRWDDGRQDQSGHHLGWSGYSWEPALFPDPESFFADLKARGLRVTLNLHPASGVQPFEIQYEQMAKAMGIDPGTQNYVPFNITDKRFVENYFKILHHPLEEMGVDFWWIDWQQGDQTEVPDLHPIWYLNYTHFTDMERRAKRRPLIFHRWGGLGNHRYQIGFSGDTVSNWKSLAFQPYFTATAGNVGYGYWSHDIGGHMPGKLEPELYLRWLQFGAFSPILRTHTTKNTDAERRIWAFPPEHSAAMRQSIKLRYALIPYMYTAARIAYDSGVSICRPMYYDWPEKDEAYAFQQQYMFGDDILVSPISEPVSPLNQLAKKLIWLPDGMWYDWTKGKHVQGGQVISQHYAVDEIPVFVKAGAIVPMQAEMQRSDEKPLDPLIMKIFPGDQGETRVYEDHGDSLDYQQGEFAWTRITHQGQSDGGHEVVIFAAEGRFSGMLEWRAYEIHLIGVWPPATISCNGKSLTFSKKLQGMAWRYDGETVTTIIQLPRFSVRETIRLQIVPQVSLLQKANLLDGVAGKLARLRRIMPMLNALWPKEWSPDSVVHAAQTGRRISLQPETALHELKSLYRADQKIIAAIEKLEVPQKDVLQAATAHFAELDAPVLPSWQNISERADWSARAGHQVVVFREKMWLLGGQGENGFCGDIWCSINGISWECMQRSAPWTARAGHTCIVHKGVLYLIAGRNEEGVLNDIWCSGNGIEWAQVTPGSPWPARSDHACVTFQNQLIIIAGKGQNGVLADVWCSQDGADWELLTNSPKFQPRAGLAALVYDGMLWISGGHGRATYADAWCSSDGKKWRQATRGQYALPRTNHSVIASDDKLWILGGQSPDWHCYLNDIWWSENGIEWQQVTDDADWLARGGQAVIAFDGKLHLCGGFSAIHTLAGKKSVFFNDIWTWPLNEVEKTL